MCDKNYCEKWNNEFSPEMLVKSKVVVECVASYGILHSSQIRSQKVLAVLIVGGNPDL